MVKLWCNDHVYYRLCWFLKKVSNCDKWPTYKGVQLHRFYCIEKYLNLTWDARNCDHENRCFTGRNECQSWTTNLSLCFIRLPVWWPCTVDASLNLALGRNDWSASHMEHNIPSVYCPSVPSLQNHFIKLFFYLVPTNSTCGNQCAMYLYVISKLVKCFISKCIVSFR